MDFGEVIGYGVPPKPDFWIGPQTTGTGFRESHIAFAAPDRAAVARSSTRRRRAGRRGAARAAPVARVPRHYYGAFVRDPDGNNVEAVCHRPE